MSRTPPQFFKKNTARSVFVVSIALMVLVSGVPLGPFGSPVEEASAGIAVWEDTSITVADSGGYDKQSGYWIISDDETMRAYNHSGGEVWSTPHNNNGNRVDSFDSEDGVAYAANGAGRAKAFDTSTGDVKWDVNIHSDQVYGVAVNGSDLYSASYDQTIKKSHASNGTEQWSYSLSSNGYGAAADDTGVYAGVGSSVMAVDSDKTQRWQTSISGNAYQVDEAGGWVFALTYGGDAYKLNKSTGNIAWTYSDMVGAVYGTAIKADAKTETVHIGIEKNSGDYDSEILDFNGSVIDTTDLPDEPHATGLNSTGDTLYAYVGGQGYTQMLDTGEEVSSGSSANTVSVVVKDENGNPVPNATVYSAGFDYANYTGNLDETRAKIQNIRDRLNNIEPPQWQNQTQSSFSVTASDGPLYGNTVGLAAHTKTQWENKRLGQPKVQFDAGEPVVFSAWGPECGGILPLRDDYEEDLEGLCVQDDHKVVLEHLGPNGTVQDSIIGGTQTYDSAYLNEHDVKMLQDPQTGFYRIYPKGHEEAAYVIVVGEPDQIISGWERELKNKEEELVSRSKYYQNLVSDGKIQPFKNTTGADGRVNISYPSNVNDVKLLAYDTPTNPFGPNATEADVLGYYRNLSESINVNKNGSITMDAYGGAIYVSDPDRSPYINITSSTNGTTEVGVTKVSLPAYTNMTVSESFADWFDDYLANTSLGFGAFNYSVSNATDLIELRDKYAGMVEESDDASAIFCKRNPEWCDEYNQTQFEDLDADNLTRTEGQRLVEQVGELAYALRETPVSLDKNDIVTNIDNRTKELTTKFNLPSPPGSLENVNLTVFFEDGSQTQIRNKHLQLEALEMNGDKTVLAVSQWPVPDKKISNLEVDLADSTVSNVQAAVSDAGTQLNTKVDLDAVPDSLADVTATLEYEDGTTDTIGSSYLSLESRTLNGEENVLHVQDFPVQDTKTAKTLRTELAPRTGNVENKSLEQTLYLNTEIPFSAPGDLNWAEFSEEDVTVIMHSQAGETTTLDTDYWTVEQPTARLGNPSVVVSDYPLENDTAVKRVEVVVAGEAGIGRVSSRIQNPGFSGQIPGIESIDASTLYPGPKTSMTVSVNPKDNTTFGELKNATVRTAAGATVTANISNGNIRFTTNGTGTHVVKLRYSNEDGDVFASTFEVDAKPKELDGPATLVARPGTNSLYALAGDELKGGSFTKEGIDGLVAEAVIKGDADAPNKLQVHASDLEESASGDTQIRVVRGSEGKHVRSHVSFTLHTQSIPDDAHVYIGECPVPADGNDCGEWNVNGTTTVIQGVTQSDGTRTVEVIRNPGWSKELRWEFRQLARSLSFDAPLVIVWPSGLFALGFVVTRRRDDDLTVRLDD